MNRYTEQQIEEKLKILTSIEPHRESIQRVNQHVRKVLLGTNKKPTMRNFYYYAAASAAILLMGISVLYNSHPVATLPKNISYMQSEPQLTLAKLNAVFEAGGHKALDDYFEMVEQNRQPRVETITLQELMTEL